MTTKSKKHITHLPLLEDVEVLLNRIAKKIHEGTLGKWILDISQKGWAAELKKSRSVKTRHVFIDLESVKKDTEYELFFLRKEDGARYFSPRLIRNIKIISDLGAYFGEEKQEDPLLNIGIWQDKVAYTCAGSILKASRKIIEKFYSEAMRSKDYEVVETLNKAFIALMLASNSHNLSHNLPLKNCHDYFHDFLVFLRQSLKSTDYQKIAPSPSGKLADCIVSTIQFLCRALYTELSDEKELSSMVHGLIRQAGEGLSRENLPRLADRLAKEYVAMETLLKPHVNGPLNKVLSKLEEGECHAFDPLLQDNRPTLLYTASIHGRKCRIIRLPSPTYQEFIQKADLNEEFKVFLATHSTKKFLIFNFQDRTLWKEQARCRAIENLTEPIEVVTLPKDTAFYLQLPPYHEENHTNQFIKEFKKQISSKYGGFLFPERYKKELMHEFVDEALHMVHRTFFSEKNVLTREQRLDFIEIFYLFLQLKIIELAKPETIAYSCKDGLDISCTAGALLFAFLKLCHREGLTDDDKEHLDQILYGPCLLVRERVVLPERFHRMATALKALEASHEHLRQCQAKN